jgi:predicted RNase H-like HicB family nuclease
MNIHEEVLEVANRLACRRSDWSFTPLEVVQALPSLNENSVRTHIVSRCCLNAPKNHLHKWDYFRRIERGRYQVLANYRVPDATQSPADSVDTAERQGIIHAVIRADRDSYTAECLEVAVVTQGGNLDEVARNLQEAIKLHLDGENLAAMGLSEHPRLQLLFDAPIQL